MTSKRGRKRNDNLPPNRARDVQRAFRARRAAHLKVLCHPVQFEIISNLMTYSVTYQDLEERVAEVEEENNCLRQALNLPPSNRPPLGRGPTGKDKPKNYELAMTGASLNQPLVFAPSRESSAEVSPGSRTSSSLSPDSISASMSSRPMQAMESGSSWNNKLLIDDSHSSSMMTSVDAQYELTPMTAPLPLKPSYASYTSSSLPSSSRGSISNDLYNPGGSTYSNTSDRLLSQSYSGQGFSLRDQDIREEASGHYSYTSSSFQAYDQASVHSPSPSPSVSAIHPHFPHQAQQHHRQSPIPFTPASGPSRRCMTDTPVYPAGQGFSSLSHPIQIQAQQVSNVHHPSRPTDFIRNQSEIGQVPPSFRHYPYGQDSRLSGHALP